LTLTAADNNISSRPCWFCEEQHWDRECERFPEAEAVYFVKKSDERYEYDVEDEQYQETQYEVLQKSVYQMTEVAQDAEVAEKRFAESKAESLITAEDSNEFAHSYFLFSHVLSSTHRSPSSTLVFKAFSEDLRETTFVELTHTTTESATTTITSRTKQKKTLTSSTHECQVCKMKFRSQNKLFLYLKKTQHYLKTDASKESHEIIVESMTLREKAESGYTFKDYNFCEIQYKTAFTEESK
jgi:hypothetical protein